VKLQTKSSRGLSEQTEAVIGALKQAIEQFRSIEPKEGQAVWTAAKALALGLADLDEALDRGDREIERARRQIAELSLQALKANLHELHRSRSWIKRRLLRPYHDQVLEIVQRDAISRHTLFDAFSEGYGLIRKRLHRVMAAEGVQPVPCEDLPVDPELMTVLEVVDSAGHPPGMVTKELRRGYTWRGRVLRYAEVQAARSSPSLPEANSDRSGD
jgi:molecular chaperone GrpE